MARPKMSAEAFQALWVGSTFLFIITRQGAHKRKKTSRAEFGEESNKAKMLQYVTRTGRL